jgi:hypothetical protein
MTVTLSTACAQAGCDMIAANDRTRIARQLDAAWQTRRHKPTAVAASLPTIALQPETFFMVMLVFMLALALLLLCWRFRRSFRWFVAYRDASRIHGLQTIIPPRLRRPVSGLRCLVVAC